MAAEPSKHAAVETAPDPDEDDLDDLDDVLDEFTAKPTPAAPAPSSTPSTSKPSTDKSSKSDAPPELPDDFAEQMQSGMADLLAELDSDPEMQKQFEAMMKELISDTPAPSDKETGDWFAKAANLDSSVPPQTTTAGSSTDKSAKASTSSAKADPFGDTIRKTMERMQASGDKATAATTSKAAEGIDEDFLAQMLKELQAGGGEGGEEDFNKMLMGMMTQLTNKEILYEPMKELHEKFPGWLEKNGDKTSKDDLVRYHEQQTLVREIVTRFERKQYSDDNEEDREYIVDRMQRMQAAGSPPPDLVGDMSAAQEVLGDLDAGCPTQ